MGVLDLEIHYRAQRYLALKHTLVRMTTVAMASLRTLEDHDEVEH